MMKSLLLLAACCTSLCAFEVALFDAQGKPFKNDGLVHLEVEKLPTVRGVQTVKCALTNLTDAKQFIRITAIGDAFSGKNLTVYDGAEPVSFKGEAVQRKLLTDMAFTLGAVWDGQKAQALAIGAEDLTSFADMAALPIPSGAELRVSVNAALLRKGAGYICTFHQFPFNPKYGIRDALAAYYELYPRRFKRNPAVNPAVYGINDGYKSWYIGDPEQCRFCNGVWEWCFAANRSWGDDLNTLVPTDRKDYFWIENQTYTDRHGKRKTYDNSKLSIGEFDVMLDERLDNGAFCGISNGFYNMSISCISNAIARKHPDSIITHHGFGTNYYNWGTDVFTFPEVSWGQTLRKNLAELAKRRDIGIIAFDVSGAGSIYRGEGLMKMSNVGFDQYGEGVTRGVANAELAEYVHTLKCKNDIGMMGVAINTNRENINDILYADNIMVEATPWSEPTPFPLGYRFFLGEKALQLWEGYYPEEFNTGFYKWPQADRDQFIRDLSRCAVHRSLESGVSLPGHYLTEYTGVMSSAFVRCNDAGWKPIPGAIGPDYLRITRYGDVAGMYLAVCNMKPAAVDPEIQLFGSEIDTNRVSSEPSQAPVLAPFFGGKSETRLTADGKTFVKCHIPRLLATVLESAAVATGEGTLEAEITQCDLREIAVTVVSRDFTGCVMPSSNMDGSRYRLVSRWSTEKNASVDDGNPEDDFKNKQSYMGVQIQPGARITYRYRTPGVHGSMEALRSFAFFNEKHEPQFVIQHGDSKESYDAAWRIERFFSRCAKMSFAAPKGLPAPVKVVKNESLGYHAVALTPLADAEMVSSVRTDGIALQNGLLSFGTKQDAPRDIARFSLNGDCRRLLNALNAERFPKYVPSISMEPEEKAFFKLRRF